MKPLSGAGVTMPNGAVCMSITWFENPENGVGLFIWAESPDPFVTWQVTVRKDDEWYCYAGHYYTSLSAAIADYQARGGSTT